MSQKIIAEKIALFRRQHSLTIRELAAQSGLSAALLSQLERSLGNPTLFALSALADAMGITLAQLVEEPVDNASLILRKAERRSMHTAGGQLLYDVVSSRTSHSRLELLFMELPPFGVTQGGLVVHPFQEEITLVLSGQLLVHFAEETFLLEEGDSIRILPGRAHYMENPIHQATQVLFAQYKYD